MNVLILTSSFHIRGHFVFKLATRLKEKGLNIFVLAPHYEGAKKYEIIDGMKIYRFPYFYPTKYQRLAHGWGIPSNLKRSNLAKVQVPLLFLSELYYSLKIVKKEKIDLINSHWLIPQGLVGAICKKVFKIPHITTIHSSEITLVRNIPMGMKIAEFVLKNSNIIISVSLHRINELLGFISSEIGEFLKNRIQIISMGVDLSEFRNKIDKNKLKAKYSISQKFVVLFIGRLIKAKGCQFLIKGFKSVLDKFRDTQLIIIGTGPFECELKKTVQNLKIDESVRFEGSVEHYKVSDYYSLSDVIVFPSIVDSSGFQEGFSVSLMEALAAGKPIVATRTKGFLEAIEDGWNGFLVEPESPEGIANKVSALLDNEELRDVISKNALESSKKYDGKLIAGKYIEIFRNLN